MKDTRIAETSQQYDSYSLCDEESADTQVSRKGSVVC